jgi:predicted membrane-bound spermidine synthase
LQAQLKASGWTYAGLFMVSCATLMNEILLTRIFSVTMWYHFAFVAISIALFGMTLGALRVYLSPAYFDEERTNTHLARSALLFAVSIVLSFLVHANLPFVFAASFSSFLTIAITYLAFTLPFFFSGICFCLALTRFPKAISRLYAADLVGAALGCVMLIYALHVTDGPTAVFIVAGAGALGSLFFALQKDVIGLRPAAFVACLGFLTFASVNTFLVWRQEGLIHLKWAKGHRESPALYVKWNSFSRVSVRGNLAQAEEPFGWGLSSALPRQMPVRQLVVRIDDSASTMLTHFSGDLDKLAYLRYDITNIVHYIRPGSRVLVVGSGGGRDVLSALVFHQKQVVGVEINDAILNATNKTFGDFTGHLDRLPQVKFVNDEARSYITRQRQPYDIIQISLVDTWAATAAGALVLTENSLYTVNAWKIFLERLTARGVLSVSHWYTRTVPYSIYRLTSLANAALRGMGVHSPRNHIIIVRNMLRQNPGNTPDGLGTLLVSREPFSSEDLDRMDELARRLKFEVVLSPRYALDPTFAILASSGKVPSSLAALPMNLAPPTDNKPFFFYWVRPRDLFNPQTWRAPGTGSNWNAVFILGSLLLIVTVLTILSIIVPLILRKPMKKGIRPWPMLTFFAAIGLGFMLIEISQMQRLMIFLGEPVYGLSVVLFALLLSSGLGSYLTRNIYGDDLRGKGFRRLSGLLGALILFGLMTPPLMSRFAASTTPVRILVAVGILLPLGFLMGMPFPLGLKQASMTSPTLTPWLWGINGATSVYASVLAIVVALAFGISATFWLGFACYAAALIGFLWGTERKPVVSELRR